MMEAIELGFCMLGTESTPTTTATASRRVTTSRKARRDRRGYVVLKRGEIWAKQMEEV